MSFAEDNGHDIGLFYEHDGKGMELDWEDGFHTDQYGNTHNLTDMTADHLINTINFFDELDTSPLQKELNKRNHVK